MKCWRFGAGNEIIGVPYGIRTRVTAVRGRCPGPLDEGDEAERPYLAARLLGIKPQNADCR
jgi:hypothetical protein